MKCKVCGAEMIQKNRWKLAIVGIAMMASIGLAYFVRYLWIPGILLELTGIYLLVWATLGKGCWCRQCKTFRIG